MVLEKQQHLTLQTIVRFSLHIKYRVPIIELKKYLQIFPGNTGSGQLVYVKTMYNKDEKNLSYGTLGFNDVVRCFCVFWDFYKMLIFKAVARKFPHYGNQYCSDQTESS